MLWQLLCILTVIKKVQMLSLESEWQNHSVWTCPNSVTLYTSSFCTSKNVLLLPCFIKHYIRLNVTCAFKLLFLHLNRKSLSSIILTAISTARKQNFIRTFVAGNVTSTLLLKGDIFTWEIFQFRKLQLCELASNASFWTFKDFVKCQGHSCCHFCGLKITKINIIIMKGSPGLVVMGGDSCSKGHGFESRHHILDGHDIFHIDLL